MCIRDRGFEYKTNLIWEKAVSYTHLALNIIDQVPVHVIGDYKLTLFSGATHDAVSYTHLDVYKRQYRSLSLNYSFPT